MRKFSSYLFALTASAQTPSWGFTVRPCSKPFHLPDAFHCLELLNTEHLFPCCSLQTLSSFSSSNPCEASIIRAVNNLLLVYRPVLQCHQGSLSPKLRQGQTLSRLSYSKLRGEPSPKPFCLPPRGRLFSIQVAGACCSKAGSFQQFFRSVPPSLFIHGEKHSLTSSYQKASRQLVITLSSRGERG